MPIPSQMAPVVMRTPTPEPIQSPANLLPVRILILDKDNRPATDAETLTYLAKIPRLVNGTLVFPAKYDGGAEQRQQKFSK